MAGMGLLCTYYLVSVGARRFRCRTRVRRRRIHGGGCGFNPLLLQAYWPRHAPQAVEEDFIDPNGPEDLLPVRFARCDSVWDWGPIVHRDPPFFGALSAIELLVHCSPSVQPTMLFNQPGSVD